MAVYEYNAKDEAGNIFSGTYTDVSSVSLLRTELTKLGYTLVKAKRKREAKNTAGKVKKDEVVAFAYRFAGMCSAGLSVLQLRSRIACLR